MKRSLRQRILYNYLAIIIMILVGVSMATSVLIREYFIASKQNELIKKAYELSRVVDNYYEGRLSFEQFVRFMNYVDDLLDARILLVDDKRDIVIYSNSRRVRGETVWSPRQPGQGPGFGMIKALYSELEPVFSGKVVSKAFYHPVWGESMIMVAVPFKNPGGFNGAMVLSSPVRGIDQFLLRLYYYIGAAGLFALVITFFVARYLAKGIVSPLKEMQESAASMAQGDYDIRVAVKSEDEVGELGKSLNTLGQELSKFVSNTAKMEKMRRDFVANVSHELRTPLTIIRGYTEAFLDGTITNTDQAGKYHLLMRDETVRLEGLINELLDLSRLQADHNPMAVEKLPLDAIAESVVMMLRQRADHSRIGLTLKKTDADFQIVGNGDRLTQLLLIFIDNAIKFTPAGGTVTVGLERSKDRVVLTVADTGVGIGLEDLEYIWERFYKADKSHTRSGAGTGLGLAIAREIISRHGGEAEVASRLGEGTTFKMTFPGVADGENR